MKAVITFNSTSHALAADQALAVAGLPAGVMGRPVELGSDCGFCLRLDSENLPRALEILRAAGLAWQGAYFDTLDRTPRFQEAPADEAGPAPASPGPPSPDPAASTAAKAAP